MAEKEPIDWLLVQMPGDEKPGAAIIVEVLGEIQTAAKLLLDRIARHPLHPKRRHSVKSWVIERAKRRCSRRASARHTLKRERRLLPRSRLRDPGLGRCRKCFCLLELSVLFKGRLHRCRKRKRLRLCLCLHRGDIACQQKSAEQGRQAPAIPAGILCCA